MTKTVSLGLLLSLLAALPSVADEAEEQPAPRYDEVNTPLDQVIARATQAQRPIFIEFFADG